jgi:hypothetical protein
MRKAPFMLAAVAVIGIAFAATPGSASPLASKAAVSHTALPAFNEGLVQKVHGWHCKKQWSKRLGWHRDKRACDGTDYTGRSFIPGHVKTPYGYADCRGPWHRHRNGTMHCHGILVPERYVDFLWD